MVAFFKRKKELELEPLPPLPPDMSEDLEPLPEIDVPKDLESMPSEIETPIGEMDFTKMPATAPLPKTKAKVFVKIDKYENMLDTIDEIKTKIVELEETINKVSEIKNKESEILDGWKALLMDTKRRIDEVNSVLIAPEN